ncbi:MAG TPA: hypothetical protein VMF06_16665 [Candidatus Limnocylindria bacterium]|jgi:hypothetical protein|nr:hypothetical protein [Candidatus Limnocylindria bacterium]
MKTAIATSLVLTLLSMLVFLFLDICAGAHLFSMSRWDEWNLLLPFGGFLCVIFATITIGLDWVITRKLKPFLYPIVVTALGFLLFAYQLAIFTFSYRFFIDTPLRKQAARVVREQGQTWTNNESIFYKDGKEQHPETRQLLRGVRLTEGFRGLWIFDPFPSDNPTTTDRSWAVVFQRFPYVWGSAHGNWTQIEPLFPGGNRYLVKKRIARDDWVFFLMNSK